MSPGDNAPPAPSLLVGAVTWAKVVLVATASAPFLLPWSPYTHTPSESVAFHRGGLWLSGGCSVSRRTQSHGLWTGRVSSIVLDSKDQ